MGKSVLSTIITVVFFSVPSLTLFGKTQVWENILVGVETAVVSGGKLSQSDLNNCNFRFVTAESRAALVKGRIIRVFPVTTMSRYLISHKSVERNPSDGDVTYIEINAYTNANKGEQPATFERFETQGDVVNKSGKKVARVYLTPTTSPGTFFLQKRCN